MKKIIFLSLVIVLLPTMVWAQEKVEAPVINLGSKWTYRADNGWEWTQETIGEEKDVYIFFWKMAEGRRKGEWKLFYDKKNMNCVKILRQEKEDREERDFNKRFFDFPLFVGKKWTWRYTYFYREAAKDIDFLAELSTAGFEDVEVPAGKFKAIKVKAKISVIGGRMGTGVYYYWYSPDVKALIKHELERGDFWRLAEYMKSELVSFELK